MVLTSEQKRNLTLAAESALLRTCAEGSVDVAVELGQCQVNGLMNAMMRLQGNQATAAFTFQLSDRVCGGLPAPDDFQNIPSVALQEKAFEIAAQKTKKAVLTSVWWWGFFCGALTMAGLTYLRFH